MLVNIINKKTFIYLFIDQLRVEQLVKEAEVGLEPEVPAETKGPVDGMTCIC